ncbi:hypothetical protein E2562_034176 [Oryza meyeriana var. granulata]|uniref:Uncharacterized protein n=1 Tax=Oryza meyeriana var. granulata TaxID=110450 RepID=A0A6G1ESE2_9ORYZ|nr:hypothetical protein E2562_034176 [Oryza meyeriana var. granulata]
MTQLSVLSSSTSKPIDPKEEPKSVEASTKPLEAKTTLKPIKPMVVKNKSDSKDTKTVEKTKFECTFCGKAGHLVERSVKNALGP